MPAEGVSGGPGELPGPAHVRPAGYSRSALKPFSWVDELGQPVTEAAVLARLGRLALPPAWAHVWAALSPDDKVQATGVDSRGRTQYRYSAAAQQFAANSKFEHVLSLAAALPMLRKQVETDLRQKPGRNGRLEPLAVRLLDAGLFRVGNERYVRDNHTYGLTTLNRSQVRIDGKQTAVFDFIGKEHLHHVIAVDDRSATAHLKMLLSAPGLESDRLFQIQRAGGRNVLSSGAVNSYLHAHTGAPVTAKVFRTWGATVAAASVAAGSTFAVVGRAFSHNVLPYAAAAELLGDTVSVAKNSYVHPQAVLAGRSPEVQNAVGAAREKLRTDDVRAIFRSASVQTAVLTFLENNPLD